MGRIKVQGLTSRQLAVRPIFVRPPEPPPEFLMYNPANSIYVGPTKIFHIPFHWTYENITNPHIAVVGITGAGKSYFVKTFLTRASFIWGTNALIIDWAGEYRAWVKQTGGKVVSLGKGDFLNLLDLGGAKPIDRCKQIIRSLEIMTDLRDYPEQRRLIEESIEATYEEAGFDMGEREQKDSFGNPRIPPTLKDVLRILEDKLEAGAYEYRTELENAIYKIKHFTREGEDFFAQQSTVKLEELTSSGLVDLDLSGLPDETFRGLAALSILQFLKERMRETGWAAQKGLRLLVVLDEAWKVAKDDESDAVTIVREGRKYQFGLIVASQNPTDINEAIFSNVGTTFILRVKFEKFLDYLQGSLNFSPHMREQIERLGVGQCAVNIAFQTTTEFPETFLIERIYGEEPLEEYYLDTETGEGGEAVAQSFGFEKGNLKTKLRSFGLDELRIEEVIELFDKKNKHMDVVSFVLLLERYGLARANVSSFLKDIGVDDATLITVFSKVDAKRSGFEDKDIHEIVLQD